MTPTIALLARVAAGLAGLALVMRVYATGQTALAAALLAVLALAAWVYGSRRSGAWRYLFPGVAAALVFVVFPMLYTIGIGFTNRSSTNLLDHDRARAVLVGETAVDVATQRAFRLQTDGARHRLAFDAAPPHAAATTEPFALDAAASPPREPLTLQPAAQGASSAPWRDATMRETIDALPALRARAGVRDERGRVLEVISLREFAQLQRLYEPQPDGAMRDRLTGNVYRADPAQGFYVAADGQRLAPGFEVDVGLRHYAAIFGEARFREPFLAVFAWTIAFAALSVAGAAALGLVLAALLSWDRLRGRGLYRVILFLPYAVPGFLSILVFKGLFNQNLGEVNLVLDALFGVRPAWFSDPWLARLMLLLVNVWLGFPYMMVLCTGLLQAIPVDLREASAEAGASPFAHFRRITLPLVARPLMPLLIAAFAFNFNNFVLVSLLTGGRPDIVDSALPAGTTDILVSYTWRIAFNDSGQQYGLAAAISTLIFAIVAALTLVQLRASRRAQRA